MIRLNGRPTARFASRPFCSAKPTVGLRYMQTTWYDSSDFILFYKFKFDGKTYVGRTWEGDTGYKKGKNWYNTFWDHEFYSDWNQW